MNTFQRVSVAAIAVLASLPASHALGCPGCNIHNYLAESIHSSTNVFVGQVIGKAKDGTTKVKVLRVLRGNHAVDSTVQHDMYRAGRYKGEQFIFCDSTFDGPRFDVIPTELEEEVRFLTKVSRLALGDPEGYADQHIDNIEEAVRRVQGVSYRTHSIGMAYVNDHHEEAVQPLIRDLDAWAEKVKTGKGGYYHKHRRAMLVAGLLAKPSEQGTEYVFAQIDALPRGWSADPEQLFWPVMATGAAGLIVLLTGLRRIRRRFQFSLRTLLMLVAGTSMILGCTTWYLGPYGLSRSPSPRGEFLKDMLTAVSQQPELAAETKKHLLETCPNLQGVALAEVVYAMIGSGMASTGELVNELQDGRTANSLALGLYFAGNEAYYWRSNDAARAYWDKAIKVARSHRLKAAITVRRGSAI